MENSEVKEQKPLENDEKLNKFKALAVKLKKELKEAKDQLEKSTEECCNIKLQLKNLEKEKSSAAYQQIVKNFQSLQQEYDKLQDEYDSLKKKHKGTENDLTSSLTELTKLREEFAEIKIELDNQKKLFFNLNSEKADCENKYKELESKLIILTSDFDSERKKNIANAGLEQTITELRNQLDLKTTEIIELQDKLESNKELEENNEKFKFKVEELEQLLAELKQKNVELNDNYKELHEKFERVILENEQHKLRSSELVCELQLLTNKLESSEEVKEDKIKLFQAKIKELEEQVKFLNDEIKQKNEEFEKYKFRVCKVLKEHQTEQQNDNYIKQIKELEEAIKSFSNNNDALKKRLDEAVLENEALNENNQQMRTKIDFLQNQLKENEQLKEKLNVFLLENDKLKTLSRELQTSLVNERLNLEKSHQEKIKETEAKFRVQKEVLDEELNLAKKEIDSLRQQKTEQGLSNTFTNANHNSELSDLESIESTSIPIKRLSISSATFAINPLEEILNSIDGNEIHNNIKPLQDFTSHLTDAQNKVESLSQLLEESESSNLLLTEQNRVLKEEIRRLQRSVERLEIAENLEYLKNILIKFLSLSGGDERQQLVPVLTTILKLSRDEQNLLQQVASNDSSQSQSRHWTGYLWTGNR